MSHRARFLNTIGFTTSLWLLSGIIPALAAYPATKLQDRSGPIPVVNQSPIQLLFLQPAPDKADTLPPGRGTMRLNTTITNTLVSKESDHYAATIDMEAVRMALAVSYGALPNLEIGFSLPVAHHYDGFMDQMILDVEEAAGSPRKVRQKEDADEFTYFVKKDGKTLILGSENSKGIGDLTLRAKVKIWDQGQALPTMSTRVSAKLPTGDEDRAFGSGEPDWGFGLLLEKDMKAMSFYLNADVTFPGEAFDDADVCLREFYTIMFGIEYRLNREWSVLSQVNYVTRPFEKNTHVDPLDRRIYELLIGVNYQIGHNMFMQTGAVEDIYDSAHSSADFTFFLNVGLNF